MLGPGGVWRIGRLSNSPVVPGYRGRGLLHVCHNGWNSGSRARKAKVTAGSALSKSEYIALQYDVYKIPMGQKMPQSVLSQVLDVTTTLGLGGEGEGELGPWVA